MSETEIVAVTVYTEEGVPADVMQERICKMALQALGWPAEARYDIKPLEWVDSFEAPGEVRIKVAVTRLEDLNWRSTLEERLAKELAFAELYVRDFHHGTPGHLSYTLVAELAKRLDDALSPG